MATHDPQTTARWILDRAAELGFARAGVCSLEPSARTTELRSWLDEGKHGSMAYMANHFEIRTDPARALEGARSAVIVGDQYHARGADGERDGTGTGLGLGRIARYARGRDYHDVIKKRLRTLADEIRSAHPGAECRVFADTAPMPERELAQRAGIGWIGKHTLIIEPRLGSWLLLGGLLTTLELSAPPGQREIEDHCGTCTRCIDACPTGAITPYSVDARKCVSYLTIERREQIAGEHAGAMGDLLFGCDICQEVCPHNSPRSQGWDAQHGGGAHSEYTPRADALALLEVLGWDADSRREALKGSAMKRATLAMIRRNAAICAGNALRERDDPALRAQLVTIASDDAEEPLVRDAARAALLRADAGSAGDQ